jgi:hypothetical protein
MYNVFSSAINGAHATIRVFAPGAYGHGETETGFEMDKLRISLCSR